MIWTNLLQLNRILIDWKLYTFGIFPTIYFCCENRFLLLDIRILYIKWMAFNNNFMIENIVSQIDPSIKLLIYQLNWRKYWNEKKASEAPHFSLPIFFQFFFIFFNLYEMDVCLHVTVTRRNLITQWPNSDWMDDGYYKLNVVYMRKYASMRQNC